MNAIVALCHFCEQHGPSVLFCTQAFHSHDPNQVLDDDAHSCDDRRSYYVRREDRYHRLGSAGNQSTVDDTEGNAESAATTPTHPNPASTMPTCEACRSLLVGQPGFISNDHEARVSYVSSQHPDHPQVYVMVRQACLRSLSIEVCPGREGPMFFGDNTNGHVFSHTFYLKDAHARGLQRWYSIMVVMMDKIYLLNSWPFLVTNIRSIISELQEKAAAVYQDEQAKCPPRAQRLTMSMNPQNFRQQRGSSHQTARALVSLVADRHVYRKLHRAFTWLLKAGGNRLTEKLLEGPPTEDSIIDLEVQEETEEGFVKLYTRKDVPELAHDALVVEESQNAESQDGDDDPNAPEFTHIRHVLKVLGPKRFHLVARHVVIGNQVIIRGTHKRVMRSLIDCLKVLLPRGCCQVIYHSSTYEDSWRCNFLGLKPGIQVPSHIEPYYVIVDVIPLDLDPLLMQSNSDAGGAMQGAAPPSSPFDFYSFIVESPVELPEKAPAVLTKIEFALNNERLDEAVVDQCLVCLKEEWMNKVKVLFKFTKAGGNRTDEDTRKLLQVVGVTSEDKEVLQFWMTGLSVQYRNHMLSSAINQL